jgi:hypothetical protein
MKRQLEKNVKIRVVDTGGCHASIGWRVADEGNWHDSVADEAAA